MGGDGEVVVLGGGAPPGWGRLPNHLDGCDRKREKTVVVLSA